MVGYILGASIVSTHDGGNSWYLETPAGMVLNGLVMQAGAAVPTTY